MLDKFRIPHNRLHYFVNPKGLPFTSTKDVSENLNIFGNNISKDALAFAIECPGKGMNAYVRGLSGSGRKTLVKQVLNEIKPKARQQLDYCYVHNFNHSKSPRLIILQKGYGQLFKKMMSQFSDYIINDLPQVLQSDVIRSQMQECEAQFNDANQKIYKPFEEQLAQNKLSLANIRDGENTRLVIVAIHNDEILSPESVPELLEKGELTEADIDSLNSKIQALQPEFEKIMMQSHKLAEQHSLNIREVENTFVASELKSHLDTIAQKFTNDSLDEYLSEIIEHFIEHTLYKTKEPFNPALLYGVNVLNEAHKTYTAPIIFESTPTLTNLIGAAENEGKLPPYASITAGALLKADGGFLVIEVDNALAQSGTWATLMRTIHTGELSFAFEDTVGGRPSMISPQPIPLDVKVILIGSHQRFYELGHYESDFADNFKVLADVDTDLPRQTESYVQYAQVLRKFIDENGLLHFSSAAVAQLIEHGIRESGSKDKISARFGRVMDVAREASYLASKEKKSLVDKNNVCAALHAQKERNYAPAKRFYQFLENGTIIIETEHSRVGQINGLAVTQAGSVSYGFPARITTTIAPGKSGLIDIEGKADLSGSIHTKGVHILGGLLRHILRPDHPLSFSASIAFEQSYGGIDGDSASGAEACCLLSAITQQPIKQSLSMTGAIDQFGHIQAIGGVNEKIEGFFDCCQQNGLSGEQGVIIPVSNIDDLMLRDDVVKACEDGKFHVYAVDHVLDALAILTDTPSCRYELSQCLPYQADSLLASASNEMKNLFNQSKA
ncbi:MAG: AAA family ATPase [Gammaproteobacteria bacterium]|nr:AAA family ATPase [Gammaproteobacteria bacterium]